MRKATLRDLNLAFFLVLAGCGGGDDTASPTTQGGGGSGGGGRWTGGGGLTDGGGKIDGSSGGTAGTGVGGRRDSGPPDVAPPQDATFATDHPRIYMAANKNRLKAALTAGHKAATRFQGAADSWVAGNDVYNFSPNNAALMGQLTGDAKYCTAAIAAVDGQVTAAEAAIAAGNAPDVAGDSYLDIGNMVGDLALVYDWCFDTIPAARKTAWLAYADQAVWNVWNHDNAKWGTKTISWSGWAVDNPSDNYYYQFLRATMLLGLAAHGEIANADAWLTMFHDTKIVGELVPTFNRDLVGGGSREGTGYGVSMNALFELYDFWDASTGERIADRTPHTRASMVAFMHQVVPTLDRIAPTGDHARDSTAAFFDYHRAYLEKLIMLYPTDPVAPRAQRMLADCSVPEMGSQFMFVADFLYENSDVAPQALDGMGTVYYAPGIGETYARSGWDKHATWINLIAGPYTQSHAHQDQGSLLIYKDEWLGYDVNIESHSGLRQEVDAHSLVRIVSGGQTLEQKWNASSTMLALHQGTGWLHAAADISPMYEGQAAVQKMQREVVFVEPDAVVVYDRVGTTAAVQQSWQLVSPVRATITGAHATVSGTAHKLEVERVSPTTGVTATTYDFTADSDINGGWALRENATGADNRWLHVLWMDTAATAVAAVTDGVTFTMGGKSIKVVFNRDAVGGTLTIDGTANTLGAGVDTLPE